MYYSLRHSPQFHYSDSTREPDAFTGYGPQHNSLRHMTRPEQDEYPFGSDHFGLRDAGNSTFRRPFHASYRNPPPPPSGYRSPYASQSVLGYDQNPYRSPTTQTTGADHILQVLSQKRELYNQNAESHTSTAGRRNHPNSVTIKSNFTVPRSLQGHKLGLSNPTEVTATRGVIESAVQGHSSTPQEPHHVSFDLSEFAGTNVYKRNTVGLLIAKAITTEDFDDCMATLATARAKKYISDIAGIESHGMDSSSSDGGRDPERPTPTPNKLSPIISRISPTDKENDASETTTSAKQNEDRDDDKTVADNQSRGMIGDQSKTETPHQTKPTPFATSYSDEEIKSRIKTKLTFGAQADTSSNDIDHEHLLDAAIQEIQSEVSITYTGNGIDQKAQAQVGFPTLQAYLYGSMQHFLISIDSEWTKAAATNSSHQTKARLLEDARPLGSCAVLMHLGIRQTIRTCSVETEMIMASAVSTELDHQTSRSIQSSKISQPIDSGPITEALEVSAPYFSIFDALSRGLIGSQTRDEALEQAKKYQNSTPGPGESHRSFSLSVYAKHRALIESEKLLPPEEIIVTPNLHQFNPSSIIISYWRSDADLSAHPGVHTILHQAETQLTEITSAGYPVTLRDDFQKDTILRAATGLDRINIGNECSTKTKDAWQGRDHKPRNEKKNNWSQGATIDKAFLYTGDGCPYCGITGHDVRGCLRKAWDKHHRQMGAHCITDYREYQVSMGRGDALVEKTHRTVPPPSHLPDGGTEEDFKSVVRSGKLGPTVQKPKEKAEVASLMDDMKAFMEQHNKNEYLKPSRTKKHYSKRSRDRRKARDKDDHSETSDSDESPSEHSDED